MKNTAETVTTQPHPAWSPKSTSEHFVPLTRPFEGVRRRLRPVAIEVVSCRAIELRQKVEFSDDGTTWVVRHEEIEHRTA